MWSLYASFSSASLLVFASQMLLISISTKGALVPVYTQERRTDTALYARGLPALTEFTIHMWFYGVPDDDNRVHDYIISIATSEAENEVLLGFSAVPQQMEYQMHRQEYVILSTESSDVNDERLLGWKQHCFTWKSNGMFKWYTSKLNDSAELELWKSANVSSLTARSGGSITVLQEQDSQVGGFAAGQLTEGKVALFNMWDHEFTEEQVHQINCDTQGNLLSMANMSIFGPTNFTEEEIPCVDGVEHSKGVKHHGYMKKLFSSALQSMTLSKVTGAHLRNLVILRTSTTDIKLCVKTCVEHLNCLSLNYIKSNQTCELNDVVFSDWILAKISRSDFIDDLDPVEYIHYTSQIGC